ncbi:MAG: mechanosensitive ion channel [Gammaproteobacteria bacterium]|jgi:small-conductance mechanosensitive channel|nr:mechanosensitive ion channel [Gammaproteobacteria bacterium]
MILAWVNNNLNNLMGSAVVLMLMALAYGMMRIFLHKIIKNENYRQVWTGRIAYVSIFLSVYIVGEIWFETLRIFTALASLMGAALVVTHKELILNMSAKLLIKSKNLFKIGDHISIKGHSGEIISTGWQEFTLLSKANTKHGYLKVPNHFIFTHELINHSELSEHLSFYFSTYITVESDAVQAKKILHEIICKHTQEIYAKLKVKKNNKSHLQVLPEVFLSPHESDGSLIRLESTFFYYPNSRKKIIDLITQDWIIAVKIAHDIHFAYPAQCVHLLASQSKSGENRE